MHEHGEIEIVNYAVLTSSDTGAAGKRVDTSGDAIVEIMDGAGHKVVDRVMMSDDIDPLSDQITAWCDSGKVDVVLQCSNKIWDIHPLIPIIKAAGGIVSTWSNDDARSSRHGINSVSYTHLTLPTNREV